MRPIAVLLLAVLLLAPTNSLSQEPDLTPIASRDEAIALMQLYAGDWVARGMSRNNFDDELEAAGCNMQSLFDQPSATLANTGRCANTQGAVNLDGDLTITEGGELTGGYFSRFERAELLSSDGLLYEEGFIVQARYRAEIRQQQQEIEVRVSVDRPILREDGKTVFGMIVEVRHPDTGEFIEFSSLVFTRLD